MKIKLEIENDYGLFKANNCNEEEYLKFYDSDGEFIEAIDASDVITEEMDDLYLAATNKDFHKCEGNITFLPLKFDDCTTDLEGTCITEVQAKNIVKFVLDDHEADKTDWFCVNCGAGVSRSAAVCAAVMRILCNDDMPVFTNSYFCPNMTVYREVLNAWINRLSDENESVSTEIWNTVNKDMVEE